MYSGILQLKDDDLIQEAIAASDYFQMTILKEALDLKYKYTVVPSNVFTWAKVADLYSMPQLKDMCDRIQLVKFKEVIKHEEFSGLSKDDVVEYFKRCKQYSGISSDDLLQAALTWMEDNETFPELIQQIDLKKCTPSALENVLNHPGMPQNIGAPTENCEDRKQEKQQTMVYVTNETGIIVDANGQMHALHHYDFSNDYETFSNTFKVCYSDFGYILVKEEWREDNDQERHDVGDDEEGHAQISISRYDAVTKETIHLPGAEVKVPGVHFSIFHNDKIYMFSYHMSGAILFYDMKDHLWSEILIPDDSSGKRWRGAVVGNDLYFLNSKLDLYRLHKGKLERICTEELNIYFFRDYVEFQHISITAVHRWLYIVAALGKKIDVYCYDTESGIWTDVSVDFAFRHDTGPGDDSSVLLENKIYFTRCPERWEVSLQLYEYNLCDDCIEESTKPIPEESNFHVALTEVATEMLEADFQASTT